MADDLDGILDVDSIPIDIDDRGDAPAQIVIERNIKAQAQRRANATKYELDKIKDRVDKTMAAFELNEQLLEDNKSAFFVPDLIELEKIISDAIQKRRYQQQVMIFVVGYEDVSAQRLQTLTQINDFFQHYINNVDEKALQPRQEIDLDDVSTKVKEAMDSASKATVRLTEIKDEMSSYVEKLQGGKLASKGKKKLEKALIQAKDDIMNLTEKLMGAHTEIEEKEDQMTKLYKQLDTKNMEVMKYKTLSDKAKNNTGQFVDDHQIQLEEKDEVINDLNRMVADQDLTIKQMEHTRDSNMHKLRNASEENQIKQDTIEKLEKKVKSLEVILEDTKQSEQDLFRQHKLELETVNQDHLQELELVKVEYQEKIDALEAEKVKQWASDSEDEGDSFGRKSNTESRKSNRSEASPEDEQNSQSRKDGKLLSRQSSFINKKSSASSSRQVSAVTTKSSAPTPAQPSTQPSATPDTMSKPLPDPAMVLARPRDHTPNRGSRAKSNLEPVHEVPFEGKINIEDEEKWEELPKEQMPSAFKQYRKEALFVVKGLQTEIQKSKEEQHQKVNKMKEKTKEKEEKWDGEKKTLLRQVGTIEKLRQEAEKEADQAINQLEGFVREQEKVANLADVQEKKLKKLTPDQRAKYMGDFQSNIPSIAEISGETVNENNNEAKKEKENQPEKSQKKEEVVPPPKSIQDNLSTPDLPNQEDMGQQTTPISTMARSLQTSRQGSIQSGDDLITPGFDKERPLSASSQRSIFEKYRSQLEQRKADIVERRNRATSMHGSLLSAASDKSYAPDIAFPDEEGHQSSLTSKHRSVMSQHRDYSSVAVYSRAPSVSTESGVSMHEDMEELELMLLPIVPTFSSIAVSADVDTKDIGLSPIAMSPSSQASDVSRKSYVADHPIVQDYLKTYDVVTEFKDTLTKILSDKDLMLASDQLSEIKQLEFDKEKNVQYQVAEMAVNVEAFMKEASAIFTSLLSNDFEAPVSDLMSRVNTSKTRLGVDTLDREMMGSTPGGFINNNVLEEETYQSVGPIGGGIDPAALKQIQAKCDDLQQDLLNQRKEYEERLNNNAMVMMEMQDTIQDLQREITALAASPSKQTFSRASTASESTVDPSIVFSRLDADRNQKALKRGLGSHKVSHEQYNEAVKIMDQYTMLPAKRLVHLVKKYTHHAHMKAIEANVRHSSALDDEVFQILEKMETLQNLRAQRWGEEMDEMAMERMRLSHLLLEALCRIEQESGIFMIKPILSYQGRNQFLHYYGGKNSGVYRPSRGSHLITSSLAPAPVHVPLSGKEGAVPNVPLPTPAANEPVNRPTTQSEPRIVHVDVPMTPKSDGIPVMGSSMNLIGAPTGTTWAMASSVVSRTSEETPNSRKNSLINTPRILELDVNRMLIGQNSVSAVTRAFQSNDFLANASNGSVRSYMTIQRPSAQPNLRGNRPNSVGTEKDGSRTPSNTPYIGNGKPGSAGTPQSRRNSSGFSIHGRTKSEGALAIMPGQRIGSPPINGNHPLPPIKVPSIGEKGGGDGSSKDSRVGSAGGVSIINEETASQGRASSIGIPEPPKDSVLSHPSPPHTPPGSSLHASPTPPRIASATSSVGAGILARASLRSSSRYSDHSMTP